MYTTPPAVGPGGPLRPDGPGDPFAPSCPLSPFWPLLPNPCWPGCKYWYIYCKEMLVNWFQDRTIICHNHVRPARLVCNYGIHTFASLTLAIIISILSEYIALELICYMLPCSPCTPGSPFSPIIPVGPVEPGTPSLPSLPGRPRGPWMYGRQEGPPTASLLTFSCDCCVG